MRNTYIIYLRVIWDSTQNPTNEKLGLGIYGGVAYDRAGPFEHT